MDRKKIVRNQQGFTLIEIIAVLVLLGILAAVAVPKFLDMQGDSKKKAVEGALAAGSSNATMAYSKFLMTNSTTPTSISSNSWSDGTNTEPIETNLGDFTATYTFTDSDSDGSNDTVTVTISGGPSWLSSVASADKTKSFQIQ